MTTRPKPQDVGLRFDKGCACASPRLAVALSLSDAGAGRLRDGQRLVRIEGLHCAVCGMPWPFDGLTHFIEGVPQ